MKGSDYVKEWKKAKPILVTKTGVSELLRVLPDDPKQSDLKLYEKAATDLNGKIAMPKIKENKKALECLKKIQKDITDTLAIIKSQRDKAIDIMKQIHAAAKAFHPKVEKGNIQKADFANFKNQTTALANRMDMITSHGRSVLEVPPALMAEYREEYDKLRDYADRMLALLEDRMKAKPEHDIKKEYPVVWKKFETRMNSLPPIWAKVDALKP
jgi:hypothetical protein